MTWTPQAKEPSPHKEPSLWTNPYWLYVFLTIVLFLGLVGLGWLALENGWIPSRGG